MTPTPSTAPLDDNDLARLQDLLDQVPEPLEPLDAMALDGYLCGVLLQPAPVPPERWLQFVTDIEGRALPASYPLAELHALVRRRHAELDRAIADRQWFDPWIYQLEEDATPSETVLPWVAGFAAAMDLFPGVMDSDDPELVEPLALLYRHFDADDLEDADALLAVIDTLEPARDLAEAVEDLVRSLMLMADVTRPRRAAPPRGSPPRAGGGGGGGRRGRR
ncbi:YecA family protein [Rubrivivax sp. RP6-9]|uniref:YecA/YgfB family protein n=1 Tax=Rubrivivax sp. RP6-9 TaxID=3415750 RepID=UPI003CC52EA5